jgi:hypothetical protein
MVFIFAIASAPPMALIWASTTLSVDGSACVESAVWSSEESVSDAEMLGSITVEYSTAVSTGGASAFGLQPATISKVTIIAHVTHFIAMIMNVLAFF